MPQKVKLSDQQVTINKFAFCLLKHFSAKVKVQDYQIKINVEQMSTQDFDFLHELNQSTGNILGLNVSRSGKGLCILIGVAQLLEVPEFLMKYKREGKTVELVPFEYKMINEANWTQSKWPISNLPETHNFEAFTLMIKQQLGDSTFTRNPNQFQKQTELKTAEELFNTISYLDRNGDYFNMPKDQIIDRMEMYANQFKNQ